MWTHMRGEPTPPYLTWFITPGDLEVTCILYTQKGWGKGANAGHPLKTHLSNRRLFLTRFENWTAPCLSSAKSDIKIAKRRCCWFCSFQSLFVQTTNFLCVLVYILFWLIEFETYFTVLCWNNRRCKISLNIEDLKPGEKKVYFKAFSLVKK